MIPGAAPACESTRLQHARASHTNAAAHRAVIAITANHPARGDAWVVRTTARCTSNVAGAGAAIRQPGMSVPHERGKESKEEEEEL